MVIASTKPVLLNSIYEEPSASLCIALIWYSTDSDLCVSRLLDIELPELLLFTSKVVPGRTRYSHFYPFVGSWLMFHRRTAIVSEPFPIPTAFVELPCVPAEPRPAAENKNLQGRKAVSLSLK